jgi:hypothetical protein
MKKTLTLVLSLIVMAACAAPPTNRDAAVDTNRNANRPADAAPAITEADAIAKEKAIWDAIKNKDYAGFEGMLADNFLEVLPDGVIDRAGSLAGVKQFEPSEINFSDWKFQAIDKDVFLVVYTVSVKGKFAGEEVPSDPVRSSSVWVNRGGKWLGAFHQECTVAKASPSPTNPANAPKAAASPQATSTAIATGPDPIANEKLIWDLLKSARYDEFADLLAPEAIEVEPDNVYDKAGTVRGIRMFDASKAVLSDWKTVNFNDNTSLVIYTVKNVSASREGERHSTIWANRNSKWLAVFHHGGTPVRNPSSTPPPPPKPSASPSAR